MWSILGERICFSPPSKTGEKIKRKKKTGKDIENLSPCWRENLKTGEKKKKRKKEKNYIQLPRFTIAGTVNSRVSLNMGSLRAKLEKTLKIWAKYRGETSLLLRCKQLCIAYWLVEIGLDYNNLPNIGRQRLSLSTEVPPTSLSLVVAWSSG